MLQRVQTSLEFYQRAPHNYLMIWPEVELGWHGIAVSFDLIGSMCWLRTRKQWITKISDTGILTWNLKGNKP